eukprot:2718134-Amphidinium_carterae.2
MSYERCGVPSSWPKHVDVDEIEADVALEDLKTSTLWRLHIPMFFCVPWMRTVTGSDFEYREFT